MQSRHILGNLDQDHTARIGSRAVVQVKQTVAGLQPVETDAVPSGQRVPAEFVVLDFEAGIVSERSIYRYNNNNVDRGVE